MENSWYSLFVGEEVMENSASPTLLNFKSLFCKKFILLRKRICYHFSRMFEAFHNLKGALCPDLQRCSVLTQIFCIGGGASVVSCDSRELPDCLQHPFRQLPAGCSGIYGKSALQRLTHIQSSCFCSSLDRKTNQKQYSNYQQVKMIKKENYDRNRKTTDY